MKIINYIHYYPSDPCKPNPVKGKLISKQEITRHVNAGWTVGHSHIGERFYLFAYKA